MMKTLYLVRHTKASWDEPDVDDMHRPLLHRGVQRAKKAVRFLNEHDVKADRIVSSPAVRAFETAKLIAKGIGYPEDKITVDHRIYGGSIRGIQEVIYSTEDDVHSLMIFGHNPTITELSNLYLKEGNDFMPTMGIACISFDADKWNEIPLAKSKTEFILKPKTLPD